MMTNTLSLFRRLDISVESTNYKFFLIAPEEKNGGINTTGSLER